MERWQVPRPSVRLLALSLLALFPASKLPAAEPAAPETTSERSYRADANIVILGMTLFARPGVGGGFARLVEIPSGSQKEVQLLFASGSRPERAHGLNRMGYIEERVSESNSRLSRAEYLGFMTANSEQSLAEARKALQCPAAGNVDFVAARGEIDGTSARHTVRHMLLPSSSRWTDGPRLANRVEADLDRAGNDEKHVDLANGERPGTFLYTVFAILRSPAPTADASFVHNGKLYHLHAVKRPDVKTGAKLVASRLIASPDRAMELSGLIRNAKTGVETTFRVWFDKASPNAPPLRFEFQPKSYLRLVFEAQPTEDPAVVKAFPVADALPVGASFSRALLH